MPADAVLRFIADPGSGDFDDLAARAAEAAPGRAVPELARVAAATALSASGAVGSGRQPVLALAAEGESRLTDEILAARSDDAGTRPIKPRGVDPVVTRSWLAARQRDHRPAVLAGPVRAFDGLLAPIERRGLKFRLPAGSSAVVVRRTREAPDDGLRTRLIGSLGLAPDRLWLGWEAEGVVTPFVARWDGENRFAIPHWVRVEVGEDERLAIIDLASLGGEIRVATEARATIAGQGFVLL